MSPLCHKAARLLLIVALIASCGAHWVVLQSVAWTAMLVTRSCETSLVSALKTTFDGAHPCNLCRTIEKGKAGSKRQEVKYTATKLDAVCERSSITLFPPTAAIRWQPMTATSPVRTARPLSPPPRSGC